MLRPKPAQVNNFSATAPAIHRFTCESYGAAELPQSGRMAEHDVNDVAEGWSIVLRANRAQPSALQVLATQLAGILDRDGTVGGPIARRAADERLVGTLDLLADAAPSGRAGALIRMWRLAEFYRDEIDEVELGAEQWDDEDFDELPA